MPLQNRVDPYGRLMATPERGTLMGNRGVLHDEYRRVVAPWRTKRWIGCVLQFRGRKRQVFTPRRYSELFFLDEATSLAAGHRPCAECRRERYNEFRAAWSAANAGSGELVGADDMDAVIHHERVEPGGEKKTYGAVLSSLPDGTLIEHEDRPYLARRGGLLSWSFGGYGPARGLDPSARVRVLTPESIVRAIRAGFTPMVHPSAGGLRAQTAAADSVGSS
jgi:hypothetical protein